MPREALPLPVAPGTAEVLGDDDEPGAGSGLVESNPGRESSGWAVMPPLRGVGSNGEGAGKVDGGCNPGALEPGVDGNVGAELGGERDGAGPGGESDGAEEGGSEGVGSTGATAGGRAPSFTARDWDLPARSTMKTSLEPTGRLTVAS